MSSVKKYTKHFLVKTRFSNIEARIIIEKYSNVSTFGTTNTRISSAQAQLDTLSELFRRDGLTRGIQFVDSTPPNDYQINSLTTTGPGLQTSPITVQLSQSDWNSSDAFVPAFKISGYLNGEHYSSLSLNSEEELLKKIAQLEVELITEGMKLGLKSRELNTFEKKLQLIGFN